MLTLANIWRRTALVHRTWPVVTVALALVLIVAYDSNLLISLIFPGWVLAVGLYLLIRHADVQLDEIVDGTGGR